jgi:hypothetical protein
MLESQYATPTDEDEGSREVRRIPRSQRFTTFARVPRTGGGSRLGEYPTSDHCICENVENLEEVTIGFCEKLGALGKDDSTLIRSKTTPVTAVWSGLWGLARPEVPKGGELQTYTTPSGNRTKRGKTPNSRSLAGPGRSWLVANPSNGDYLLDVLTAGGLEQWTCNVA